nr:unnamed protein product [Callosobruchus chinensis]
MCVSLICMHAHYCRLTLRLNLCAFTNGSLVNRRVEQRQEHSITHTEITQRRVIQEQGPDMQHYNALNETVYHPHSNGHSEHSPNSSHMSVHSDEPLVRTQKQQTTQQVTTVTKVVREVQQLGDQPGEYIPVPLGSYPHPRSTSTTSNNQRITCIHSTTSTHTTRTMIITPILTGHTWGTLLGRNGLRHRLVQASTVEILRLYPSLPSPMLHTWAQDTMSFQNTTESLHLREAQSALNPTQMTQQWCTVMCPPLLTALPPVYRAHTLTL